MTNEPRINWCRHHSHPEPLEHACALGIDINAILPRKTFGHHYAMPCNTATSDGTPKCKCDKRDLFTAAEIAQQDADSQAAMDECERYLRATLPLLAQIKDENRGKDATGRSRCPVCEGHVRWTHAGSNGHVAMRCSTQDCIAFIE